ncbi:MAG: YicC family protein [Treponema sp.]|jgi:uncharacterized protein (TIGR00255 family)|nr:YicC family protein [Treponema sp.]
MKSITGYGFAERRNESVSLSVEIKGYNNRFLELSINLPPALSSLEPLVREYAAGRFKRGKVELWVRIKEYRTALEISVNLEAARAYMNVMNSMAAELKIEEKPSLALLMSMEGILEVEKKRDGERFTRLLEPVLKTAADAFETERIREGRHTEEDILRHLAALESSAAFVSSLAPELEKSIQGNLRTRFEELLGDVIDENRVLTETAALLMKYTISEEISRLAAHLGEFRAEAGRNPSPGKKLDFLCQEINREINTIGSKTPSLEVSRAVVSMKDALENIREQLRNVE